MKVDNEKLGAWCGNWRVSKCIYQRQIADDLGMTPQNISAFECGIIDSLPVLCWYMRAGAFGPSAQKIISEVIIDDE